MLVAMMGFFLLFGCTSTTTHTNKTLASSSGQSTGKKRERRQDSVASYVKLGLGYLRDDNREGARYNLQKALALDGRSPAAHNGMALLYQLEKESGLAEKHYLQALDYDGEFTRARNNYAMFLAGEGQYEKAYEQLQIASGDLDYPRRARVFLSLGQAASQLGKTEEAVIAWEKSLALNPRMVPAHLELAELKFTQKDFVAAKRHLDFYHRAVGPTARGLWLGIRLDREFANKDGEASKVLALKKMFPYSEEYLAYQRWLGAK